MDSLFLALSRADGGVSVMEYVHPDRSVEALQAEIDKLGFEVVKVTRIEREHIPSDRTYRNAWTHDGKAFGHDMTKARDLHRQELRCRREVEFPALDAAYARAEDEGDSAKKKEVAAKRRALRDLPAHPKIEAAQTVADLKALTFEVLT